MVDQPMGMNDDVLGERQSGSHEECGPIDGVELHNIFTYQKRSEESVSSKAMELNVNSFICF